MSRRALLVRAMSNCVQICEPRRDGDGLRGFGTGVHVTIAHGRKRFSAVLTAAHALPTRAQARRATCVFSAVGPFPRVEVGFDPDRLYLNCSPRTDVVVVALARNVTRAPPLPLAPLRKYPGERFVMDSSQTRLHLFHHGGGQEKVGVLSGSLVVACQDVFVFTARGFRGCSGSAIYTSNWLLYGIAFAANEALLHCREAEYRHVTEGAYLGPLVDALEKRGMQIAHAHARD